MRWEINIQLVIDDEKLSESFNKRVLTEPASSLAHNLIENSDWFKIKLDKWDNADRLE